MNQRNIILAILLVFTCLIIILGAWLAMDMDQNNSEPVGWNVITSTPEQELAGASGWWNGIPTDPAIPTAPAIALPTLTPTRTPTPTKIPNSRTQTATAQTVVATPTLER